MQKKNVSTLVAAALLLAAAPSAHAFDVGGSNGWKFSTDGFVNVFATYEVVSKAPVGTRQASSLDGAATPTSNYRNFGVNVGLLPVGIGFNINSPTVNGVDYAVRIGMYPNINNQGGNVSPDFREVNMTATGSFGQILAGRAINLYQAKNILTDMSLFGVGVVGNLNSGPTIGHIGYGYLYPLFNGQIRYTTPDMGGFKVAASINQPYKLGTTAGEQTSMPLLETELSYAMTAGGTKVQAWIAGEYERTKLANGKHPQALGGTGGVEVGMGPLDVLVSTYGGKALGMELLNTSLLADVLDGTGKERTNFGFLGQATFMVTPSTKLGVNYGQSRQYKTVNDSNAVLMLQQAGTAMATYNVTKFCQVSAEYTYAQSRWYDGAKQHANIFGLGTFLFW